METNFQTSFIPKKPVVPERTKSSKPVGMLTIISLLIFFTVLIATGALYFYRASLGRSIVRMENDLSLAKNRFEPAKITQLELLDRRLKAGNLVLEQHVALSPIFETLEDITMKSVRYTSFDYELEGEKNKTIKVSLSGNATDYRSIALQSDLFSQSKSFIDPVFSGLSLDEKGNVIFDLEFSVDPVFLDYEKVLNGTNSPEDNLSESFN